MKQIVPAFFIQLALGLYSPAHSNAAEPPENRIDVVLLGTGYPRPYPDRAGPSTAVIVNGRYLLWTPDARLCCG